ncbi:hypothetical protein AURDEDRAFT_154341 [Auricularia subglabra TFB-10046 SS5]|uniref:Uncharacterized protein n=1 Tax=Auricularia subglabra (strain TFB-10046 / SS5) TaxID=717982 RepID=J0WVW4_AURST|nr:hypothetical protein AURDEDRAFT_154341 [Auricularia subglabra TFB-10046 SS5]
MTFNANSDEVTQERIAQQFGFNTQHGAYAWRVILNSPLDSERCRLLIGSIAQPDPILHQHKSSESSSPFVQADPANLIKREPLHPAIEDFFAQHGAALALACISQLNEARHIAWSPQARPILTLFKECSFSPSFGGFVRTTPEGVKLYNAYARGVLRLIKDAQWVDGLGVEVKLDDDIKYTNFAAFAQLDALGSLLVALPTLLNVISALTEVPPARGHVKAAEQARAQLRNSMEKLAAMDPALLWTPEGEATELGDKVAFVYDTLLKVVETLRM